MSLKAALFSISCALAWFVLLPLLVVGGGATLLAYAIFAELGAVFTGHADNSLDTSSAREIARRMCLGYGMEAQTPVQPGTTPRHP